MKISLNWLKNYIEIHETPEELAALLTTSGLEVEGFSRFEAVKGGLEGLVIGEVLTCESHPNADRLKITTVNIGGSQPAPIVCGASNVKAGQKVIVATVGATLYPTEGEPFQIKKAKIRGEVSEGMICAEDEIGLGGSHDGIIELQTALPAGTPAAAYYKLESDVVFEIGLTPNRADAASHIGVARDLKALLGREVKFPDVASFEEVAADNGDIRVRVENSDAAPRYSGLVVTNLAVKESPDWLKLRLQSIGLSPINNVVDATNYVLHELGQPLHAFDLSEVTGNEIVVKTATENSTFITLDEKERKLSADDLMIANRNEDMCIAGVFGGLKSGVKETTTSIFLESACFSPDYIRKSAQRHGLKTDASFRFERGTDPNITVYALKRAALLLQEVAGGKSGSEIIDIYPKPVSDFKIAVRYKNISRLIGKEIESNEIEKILTSLDIRLTDKTEDGFTAYVPPYRVDVTREADVIEEILRIHGYDNIALAETLGTDYLASFPKKNKERIQESITQLLTGFGFSEIITNSLTKQTYAEKAAFLEKEQSVEILNKLSEDLGVLRQRLLFSGLEVVAHNINRKQKDLALFEFGTGYTKENEKYLEKRYLSMFLTGNIGEESWQRPANAVAFHDISSVINRLLRKFYLPNYTTSVIHEEGYQYALRISVGNKTLATWGKLSKDTTAQTGIKQEVFYGEFDWALLLKYANKTLVYQEVSRYPEVKRDLSLVIDKGVTFDEIEALAKKTERKLLKKINVFDVYEGESIGSDKKAYALSFTLQDQEKTLTDNIIDKTMTALINAYQNNLGAVIRK